MIVSIHRIFNDDGDDDDDGDDGSSLTSSVVINTNPRAAFVSLCQTQMRPNETQTNLLTGFVSLQTDISWQPERNICENEILDPDVTAACHMAESRRQFCRKFFRVAAAFSQGACRASLQQICTFFFFGFNLKFVRWAAGEGAHANFVQLRAEFYSESGFV